MRIEKVQVAERIGNLLGVSFVYQGVCVCNRRNIPFGYAPQLTRVCCVYPVPFPRAKVFGPFKN